MALYEGGSVTQEQSSVGSSDRKDGNTMCCAELF